MFVKTNRNGKYRGQNYSKSDIIEVSDDLGNRIIANGQGSKSSKEEYEKQEAAKKSDESQDFSAMSVEGLKAFDYSDLNREPLEAYAIALKIDEIKVKDAPNKGEIKALIAEALK